MAYREAFKRITQKIVRALKRPLTSDSKKDESGIALFMVISAMTILSVLVTEFTYVAQVNATMAFDSTDQIKAHYLAKTGLKISLLRLKAYKELKALGGSGGSGGGGFKVPRQILEQVWAFPFIYPIPKEVPGMTPIMRDQIDKFQNDSGLTGRFTATIESASNKLNLNSMLQAYGIPSKASPSPSPGAGPNGGGTTPTPTPTPADPNGTTKKEFDPEAAREAIKSSITEIIKDKFEDDQDFAAEYRDLNIDELFDNIASWVDWQYESKFNTGRQKIPFKRAPFYSINELRMIYPMDDALFDLLAPNFTTFLTSGINANTIAAPMLRALLPGIKNEEVTEFFKYRDDPDEDHKFNSPDEFFKYVEKSVQSFRDPKSTEELKKRLESHGQSIIVDEETFKITVVSEVNKASRVLEVWVTLQNPKSSSGSSGRRGGGGADIPSPPPGVAPESGYGEEGTEGSNTKTNSAGLRVLFMRES